jgi:hypothetical protein
MNTFAQLVSLLLASRNQAHIFHLQTNSYSAHIALSEYYEGIITFVDGLVEGYQGKHGVLTGYNTKRCRRFHNS